MNKITKKISIIVVLAFFIQGCASREIVRTDIEERILNEKETSLY